METATQGLILASQHDAKLDIQINRPEKKNALTNAMYSQLAEALRQAQAAPDVRVVTITGSADSFTSGNDLNDFLRTPPHADDSPVFDFLATISTFEKPLIAAVNGLAIGIGTTMLLHCDLVYASETASFQLPFINLALVPEAASSLLLPGLMGHQRAAELLLLGDRFSAQQACEYGLVNQVLSASELTARVEEVAAALAQKAPEAMRLSKMLLKQAMAKPIQQTMLAEGELFAQRLQSAEAQEVMQAFVERRQPDFSKL